LRCRVSRQRDISIEEGIYSKGHNRTSEYPEYTDQTVDGNGPIMHCNFLYLAHFSYLYRALDTKMMPIVRKYYGSDTDDSSPVILVIIFRNFAN
jgi:hypothetical protein